MALQTQARDLVRKMSVNKGSWSMIGPRELATVIGKLDRLECRPSVSDRRARPGSSMMLLDFGNDCVISVTLTEQSQSDAKKHEISIFSPLGCALLSAEPGKIVSVDGFSSGYRYLVIQVNHAPED